MGCEWLKTADGAVIHVNYGRGRGRKRHCKFCHQDYHGGKQCDFPVGNGRTCDAEMCDACARRLGTQETEIGNGRKRLHDSIDVCPIHRSRAVAINRELRDAKLSLFDEASR